jgi:hypothetical protein
MSMNKLLLAGGIGLAVAGILMGWLFVAGAGLVLEKLPHWLAGAEKNAMAALGKAQAARPLIEEKAGELSPEIAGMLGGVLAAGKIPDKDVGGEDVAGVPRYPGLVRVSFRTAAGKKTVGYKGAAQLGAVVDFYGRELGSRGFTRTVKSAAPRSEIHEYARGEKILGLSFRNVSIPGGVITEVVVRELWPGGAEAQTPKP